MESRTVRDALTTPYVTTLIEVKARQLIRRPGFRRSELRDLEQELVAAVLRQAHHYDPARGSVNTFIDRVVETAAVAIIRRRMRLKRGTGRQPASLDVAFGDDETSLGDQATDEDRLRHRGGGNDEDVDLRIDVEEALTALGPVDRAVCRRLMLGESVSAAARGQGISRRQVRKAVETIRQALEDAGLKEFFGEADNF